jgi:HK97 gp10 family phage protein
VKIHVQLPDLDVIDRELGRVEQRLRTTALKKALRAGGRVVAARAKQLAPRSIQTGTWDAWSKSTEEARRGAKPLAETIGVTVRDYGHTLVLLVGPEYPAGALGHLVEYGHAEYLWGQATGRRVPPKPFMRPAADETEDQVDSAVIDTLRKEAAA